MLEVAIKNAQTEQHVFNNTSDSIQASPYALFISVSSSFFINPSESNNASISAGLYIFALGFFVFGSNVNTANSTVRPTSIQHHNNLFATPLTFLTTQSRAVHRLTHRLKNKRNSFFHRNLVFVFLLEKTLCSADVRPDTGRFPARVVARWIRVV